MEQGPRVWHWNSENVCPLVQNRNCREPSLSCPPMGTITVPDGASGPEELPNRNSENCYPLRTTSALVCFSAHLNEPHISQIRSPSGVRHFR